MKNLILLTLLLPYLLSCSKDNSVTENTSENEIALETYTTETLTYKTVANVNSNLLSADIYYPVSYTSLRPVIIYVHGGGWCTGDKANQIENKINFCREEKYVLVSVNYRLSPYPYETDNPNRVMFPTHNTDVADAIKKVVDNIESYGGDPNKIALLGHSAGAHLVALTGTNPYFLNNVGLSLSSIKGVACIDTKGYDITIRTGTDNTNEENRNMYINAFGTNPEQNINASPFYNVVQNTLYPNFFIATRGSKERIENASQFYDKLTENNINATFINANPYSHSGINNAIGEKGETLVSNPLRIFFRNCFGL